MGGERPAAEDSQARVLADASADLQRRTMSVLRVAFIPSAGLELFAALSVALVGVYAGFSLLGLLRFHRPDAAGGVLRAGAGAGLLCADAQARRRLSRPAGRGRIVAVFSGSSGNAVRSAIDPLRGGDRALSDDDRPALDGLSFEAFPGEIVVLLGCSGSGKTTALNLLRGLATLTAGEVRVRRGAAVAGQEPQEAGPPVAVGSGCRPVRQVALRQDADEPAILARHRQQAHPALDHQGCRLSGSSRRARSRPGHAS
nr:ATP-binding cassette domain-containing protein [uncultured Lichenicoccus sp.]